MSLHADFEQAQTDSRTLSTRPDNEVLLRLYALYKQGSHGDVAGKRPGMLDMVGRAKYDAWAGLSGTQPEDAQRQYVDLVRDLLERER